MADASVTVELRLLTANALKTAGQFNKDMGAMFQGKGGSGASGAGGGSPMERAKRDVESFTNSVQKLNTALSTAGNTGYQAWKKLGLFGNVKPGGMQFNIGAGYEKGFTDKDKSIGTAEDVLRNEEARREKDHLPDARIAEEAKKRAAIAVEKSEIARYNAAIKAGNAPAAAIPGLAGIINRQLGIGQGGQAPGYAAWWKSAVPPLIQPEKPGAVSGIGGTNIQGMLHNFMTTNLSSTMQFAVKASAALAALRVSIGLVSYAVRMAIIPFKMLFSFIMQAADQARRFYATSLTSGGLPLGFITKRHMMADVLGVGENDVYHYMQAFTTLNKVMRTAAESMARTTPELTQLGWHWKALKWDMSALKGEISKGLAPATSILLASFEGLAMGLIKWTQYLNWVWRNNGGDLIVAALKKLNIMMDVPQPPTSAHRYQSSPWERMGLVLGVGGFDSPVQQTAKNTAKTVKLLETIAAGSGMTRAQFSRQMLREPNMP